MAVGGTSVLDCVHVCVCVFLFPSLFFIYLFIFFLWGGGDGEKNLKSMSNDFVRTGLTI